MSFEHEFFPFSAWAVRRGDVDAAVVSEPATLALLGVGLAGLGFSRRRKLNRVVGWLPRIVFIVVLAVASNQLVRANLVDYSVQPTGNVASPFHLGGVTATSSEQLAILNGNGLGVGGGDDIFGPTIDHSESVEFTFDAGGATGVSFLSNIGFVFGGSDIFQIEGFGIGGTPLGSVGFHILANDPQNVSALFGDVPLSGFIILGNGGDAGRNVSSITFTPLTAPVPEPATLALLGVGLAGLGFSRRK